MLPNGWDFLFLEPQNRRLNNQFDLTFGLCWNMSSSPNQDSRLVWILEILSCKKIMITKWSLTNPIHQNLCDYFVICINLALLEPAPSNILPFTLNQLILYCLHLFLKNFRYNCTYHPQTSQLSSIGYCFFINFLYDCFRF